MSLGDPYPDYRRLREAGPVSWLDELGVHLVVGFDVASDVLSGDGWSSDPTNSPALMERFAVAPGTEAVAGSLLMSDPPRHTRLRTSVSGYFTPRNVDRIRDRIAQLVTLVTASFEPGGTWDVMADLAYPVPLAVMCELLGAPAEIAPQLRDEMPKLVATLDPLADDDAIAAGVGAGFGLMLELVPLVAARRTDASDDLLSALVSGAGALPPEDAIPLALLLLAAGHETTANLVGNAVVALHEHPDVTRAVRADRQLLPRLVDELVRYDGPVQLVSRIALHDTTAGDVHIAAGDQVLIGIGAANRDPSAFDDPDDIRLDRQRSHLAFGHGRHFCAGAALARVETQEILDHLLDLPIAIETAGIDVERGTSATFRRIERLSMTWPADTSS
jgi:cytochrome P450